MLTDCIVGRTGSGKVSSLGLSQSFISADISNYQSSLTLALLRCILTEGTLYYDDIPTSKLNLDSLRSKITIIPQVVSPFVSGLDLLISTKICLQPELLSGTVRQNLDPFSQHDDAVLNDALRSAGLFSLQGKGDSGRIALDSEISSGGSNLSVGQRQILALARAMVRQSKLLILDEGVNFLSLITRTTLRKLNNTTLDSDFRDR